MKKTITLLLLALLTSVGAWAEDWSTVWSSDFASAPTGMTYSVSSGSTSITNGYLEYHQGGGSGDRALTTTFTDSKFAVATNWKMEFDWNSSSANRNPSNVVFSTDQGTAFTLTWASYATAVVVTDASAKELTTTLPILGYNKSTCSDWSHFTITGDIETGIYLTITNGETTYVDNALVTSTFGYPSTFSGSLGRAVSHMYIDNITFSTPKVSGFVAAPAGTITAPDGTKRKFTLSCQTDNATIYYSESNIEIGADGWKTYTSEVSTSAETIYTYASDGTNNSEKSSFATGAGTNITLNAPVATKTAYSNGSYTVTLNSDQSNLSIKPTSVTYKYSINGAAEQSGATITVPEGSTLTAYVSASGYTSSSTTTCETTVRPTVVQVWTQDYTNLVSGSTGAQTITLTGTEGGDFTVGDMAFYNITGYTGTEISELNTNVGINTASYFYFRTNGNNSGMLKNANNGGSTGYIGIQNLKPGQYIVITTNGNPLSATEGCEDNLGMNTTSEYYFKATATEASIFFQHGVYNYVKTIAVYDEVEKITVATEGTSTYVTTYPLDFSNIEGLTVLIATGETEGYVELSKVTQVPAGAPIIVKGEAGDYSVPVCDATTYSGGLTNKLEGSATASYTVAADDKIYAIKKDKSEFRPVAEGVVIPEKKAYFRSTYPINANAKPFIIRGEEEDPTAVSTVEVVEAAKAKKFFNAAGQQVDENYKGFVITSAGKKIIKK